MFSKILIVSPILISLGMVWGFFSAWQHLLKNSKKDKTSFNRAIIRVLIAAVILGIAGLSLYYFASKVP